MENLQYGTIEYFRWEANNFRKSMGTADFWKDVERAGRAMTELLTVWVNTQEATEFDNMMMQWLSNEYDNRLSHVLFNKIGKKQNA